MFVVVKATVAINVIRDLRRGNLSKKYNLNEFVSIKTTGSWLDGYLRLTLFFSEAVLGLWLQKSTVFNLQLSHRATSLDS